MAASSRLCNVRACLASPDAGKIPFLKDSLGINPCRAGFKRQVDQFSAPKQGR